MISKKSKKIALVTGAGSGIGRCTALALLREGYSVVLAGRRAGPLEETAAAGRIPGTRTLVVPTNIIDPTSVEALFVKVKDVFGRLDLLFNNAGISAPPVPLEDLAFEQWKSVVDTCLTGAFFCTREGVQNHEGAAPEGGTHHS